MGEFVQGLLSGVDLFISFRPTGNMVAELVGVEGAGSLFGIAAWGVLCIGIYIQLEREGVFRRNPQFRFLSISLMILLIFPLSSVLPFLLCGYYLLGSGAGFIMGAISGSMLRTSLPFRIAVPIGFAAYTVCLMLAPRDIVATAAIGALLILAWYSYEEISRAYEGQPLMYVARAFLFTGVVSLVVFNPENFSKLLVNVSQITALPIREAPTGLLTFLYYVPLGGWVVGLLSPHSIRRP